MVAKVSRKAELVVAEALELPDDERAMVAEAISSTAPRRASSVAERHAVIAARIAEVHAGRVSVLTVEEVERRIREELDF